MTNKKKAIYWIIVGIAGIFIPLVPGMVCIVYGIWLLKDKIKPAESLIDVLDVENKDRIKKK